MVVCYSQQTQYNTYLILWRQRPLVLHVRIYGCRFDCVWTLGDVIKENLLDLNILELQNECWYSCVRWTGISSLLFCIHTAEWRIITPCSTHTGYSLKWYTLIIGQKHLPCTVCTDNAPPFHVTGKKCHKGILERRIEWFNQAFVW